jgi:hypothetical protein
MTGSSNFLQFNSGLTNALNDTNYTSSSTRTGGFVDGVAETALFNKFFAQNSAMVYALGQVLANRGLTVSDSNASGLVTALTSNMGGISGVTAISSAGSALAVADYGKLFVCTGTFSKAFGSASSLGAGWYAYFRNAGTGIVTLSTTIDGVVNPTLYPGEAYMVSTDGTSFYSIGRRRGWIPLATGSGSGGSQIDFTSYINSDFKMYKFYGYGISMSASGATLGARHSVAGVFDTAGNYNQSQYSAWNSSSGQRGNTAGTSFEIIRSLENTANQTATFEYTLFNPGDTTARKGFQSFARGETTSTGTGSEIEISGGEYEASNSAIDGARFFPSAGGGTISGTIEMEGYRP